MPVDYRPLQAIGKVNDLEPQPIKAVIEKLILHKGPKLSYVTVFSVLYVLYRQSQDRNLLLAGAGKRVSIRKG